MMRRLLAAALFLATSAAMDARAQETQQNRAPVFVELYTSQGCLSCPRANRLLGHLAREENVIALTFPVGYWDYLGWSDTFAQPSFTSRQRDYARALRFRAPYTPQLILDGARQVSADDWDRARGVLEELQSEPVDMSQSPDVTIRRLETNQVRVTISRRNRRGATADIWLFAYDPGPLNVMITAGDNANRNVTHYNLVRRVTHAGTWLGEPLVFERARCTPECAVVVQAPRGGRILAAASTRR